MINSFIKEPLVQFFILGSVLYFIVSNYLPESLGRYDKYEIVITDSKLREYLQFQRKSFNTDKADQLLKIMPEAAKRELQENFIRDEVLYREALKLGLEENDEIIRRRLIQKMEYLSQGFYDDASAISEQELRLYFNLNKDQYQIESAITFTHVFLKPDSEPETTNLIKYLNKEKVSFEKAGNYGARFLYNQNYIERTPDYILSHFGNNFQVDIFSLKPNALWQGPIKSDYGFHLVLIKEISAVRNPQLSEVAGVVLADARQEKLRELKSIAIEDLVSNYKIIIK
ncbi:MAG: peptidyl-prolyl cis-trans isomerase C [Flavobacterium sp.]|jgi:peptidyl-prolyl cis-trans isomerase C